MTVEETLGKTFLDEYKDAEEYVPGPSYLFIEHVVKYFVAARTKDLLLAMNSDLRTCLEALTDAMDQSIANKLQFSELMSARFVDRRALIVEDDLTCSSHHHCRLSSLPFWDSSNSESNSSDLDGTAGSFRQKTET